MMNIFERKVLYRQILQIYSEYACRVVKNIPGRFKAPVYVLYTFKHMS